MVQHKALYVSLVYGLLYIVGGCSDNSAVVQSTSTKAAVTPPHVCTGAPGDEGATCDDNNPCTSDDQCQVGQCVGSFTGLHYGGAMSDEARAVARLSDGGFLLVGYTQSQGAGETDGWLVRLDKTHKPVWNQTFGGIKSDQFNSLVVLGDGYLVGGFRNASKGLQDGQVWLVKTDLNGKQVWEHGYGAIGSSYAESLVSAPLGGFALAGGVMPKGATTRDADLMVVDKTGQLQWDQSFGGEGDDGAQALVALTDGYALAGFTDSSGAGQSDMWLVRTNAAGDKLWEQTYGGDQDDQATALAALPDGFAVAGFTSSKGSGQSDLWMVRTDATGKTLWEFLLGGPKSDGARAVVALADGSFALAGDTEGNSDNGRVGHNQASWLLHIDQTQILMNQAYESGTGKNFASALVALPGGGYALAGSDSVVAGMPPDMWLIDADSKGNSSCQPQ